MIKIYFRFLRMNLVCRAFPKARLFVLGFLIQFIPIANPFQDTNTYKDTRELIIIYPETSPLPYPKPNLLRSLLLLKNPLFFFEKQKVLCLLA